MNTQDPQAEHEIRELHEEWFAASSRKDLDATMLPIAPDIVSYEHSIPLQYTQIEDIREECRQGFEYQGEDFSWTVPDLQVMVREDLAVAWGLNRMASTNAEGTETVSWSRGTRVFHRTDGGWKMVHQHVSFPVDAETGVAAMELKP
ncbi:YybH family protein [Brachybacterium tyrofermentans]|uniref:YybH family protein n=1 Tax=Brachybacterium tyrofermentans TaxID=47848 RepID=UPI000A1AD1D5|nr:nuclear transport factor 2 family protein [Brachybacterium tyrofermentans]SLM96549.1 Ketosteroid isomerase homolog [Corynebacterium xerosis]